MLLWLLDMLLKTRQRRKIQKKLSYKTTWAELWEFEKLFPAIDSEFSVKIDTTCEKTTYYVAISKQDPYVDFCKRWNRFKNLKAFL